MDHLKQLLPRPPTTKGGPTLADVLAILLDRPDIRDDRRRNMISAVKCLCVAFGAAPSSVPATAAAVRQRLDGVCWRKTRFSRSYISNLKTLTLSALDVAGVAIQRTRITHNLMSDWAQLKATNNDKAAWCALSHFASFCSARAIALSEVNDEVLALFEGILREQSIKGDPAERARRVRGALVKIAKRTDALASVSPADKKDRCYALKQDAFSPSFRADVEAFMTARSTPNPFAKDFYRPVADSTTAMRRKQILQLASALVASGYPIEHVASLATLTEVENAEAALGYLYVRAGSKETPYLGQQAQLLKTIARYWVKCPVETIDRLAELTANLGVKKKGMVKKNRERLLQFDLKENVHALIRLPLKVLTELSRKSELSSQDLARGVYAMAVGILVRIPLRVSNLCHINMETEIKKVRRGLVESTHLVLEKTKNGDPYEAPFSEITLRCLDLYLLAVRPHITKTSSPFLFPNKDGKKRHEISFSGGIEEFILREIGLTVNSHLFRHLSVSLGQRFNPGDRETPRQLLNHRSSATTEGAYTVMDNASAARRYDALLTRIEESDPEPNS